MLYQHWAFIFPPALSKHTLHWIQFMAPDMQYMMSMSTNSSGRDWKRYALGQSSQLHQHTHIHTLHNGCFFDLLSFHSGWRPRCFVWSWNTSAGSVQKSSPRPHQAEQTAQRFSAPRGRTGTRVFSYAQYQRVCLVYCKGSDIQSDGSRFVQLLSPLKVRCFF